MMQLSCKRIDEYVRGDIAAAVGLKATTMQILYVLKMSTFILESMQFPEPVIELSLEPKKQKAYSG